VITPALTARTECAPCPLRYLRSLLSTFGVLEADFRSRPRITRTNADVAGRWKPSRGKSLTPHGLALVKAIRVIGVICGLQFRLSG
jgi:hypothetical protein